MATQFDETLLFVLAESAEDLSSVQQVGVGVEPMGWLVKLTTVHGLKHTCAH